MGARLEDADIPGKLKLFKRVIELDPGNIILAMETATHCAAQGQFAEAQSILEECLAHNGDSAMPISTSPATASAITMRTRVC